MQYVSETLRWKSIYTKESRASNTWDGEWVRKGLIYDITPELKCKR